MADKRPIGLFDSGVGGLTVLREVVRRLPAESTIYLGDNARTPYGPRSDDEVRRFSAECLDELAARDVKAIVVACNTSSAIALNELRLRYPVPILGVVRPGAAAAALATRTRRVGVIATMATIRSHAYFQAIKDEDPFIDVIEVATPDLVPLVEAGELEGPLVEDIVARSLAPLLAQGVRPDTLLLGCTHYPLLAPIMERQMGVDVAVIDSARSAASALAHLLEIHGLSAEDPATPANGASVEAAHLQLTTGDVPAFRRIAERLFGDLFPAVERVAVAGAA
jgi:glutamate racemase